MMYIVNECNWLERTTCSKCNNVKYDCIKDCKDCQRYNCKDGDGEEAE